MSSGWANLQPKISDLVPARLLDQQRPVAPLGRGGEETKQKYVEFFTTAPPETSGPFNVRGWRWRSVGDRIFFLQIASKQLPPAAQGLARRSLFPVLYLKVAGLV